MPVPGGQRAIEQGCPTRLGRYELMARIGEGGMAEVHLARMHGPMNFQKVVVVKTIHPDLASQPEFLEMLLDEARLSALIKHPRVVDIYELGQADGSYFMAMEYIDGQPLTRLLAAGASGAALEPCAAARVIADTADGLHAAHELRTLSGKSIEVVHRDVSPGNIMVLYDGSVKILDFGVAKARGRLAASVARQLKGKLGYMSPEQLAAGQVDRRSDVFSLGIVMWEALALRRLFPADSYESLAERLRGSICPPSAHRPQVPPVLDSICLRALAVERGERFQTALAMKQAVEAALRTLGSHRECDEIARYMARQFASAREERVHLVHRAPTDVDIELEIVGEPRPEPDEAPILLVRRKTSSPPVAVEPEPEPAPRRRRGGWVAAALVVAAGAAFAITQQRVPAERPPAAAASTVERDAPERPRVAALGAAPVTRAASAAPAASSEPPAAVGVTAVAERLPGSDGAEPPPSEPAHDDRPSVSPPHARASSSPRTTAPGTGESRAGSRGRSAAELHAEGAQLFIKGMHGQAKDRFKAAIQADPRHAPSHRGLGLVYQAQNRRAKAVAALRRYLELAPGAPDAAAIQARIDRLEP
jgi:serine/threonine-protein kinase